MMKQLFTRLRVITLFSFLCSAFLHAQVVTDERMFSFEESKIPDYITGVNSQLSISDTHYKDGKHSLKWTFEPGGVLELKKDLKFEKKDPMGKDLYLSAFIIWVYNEEPQDATIEFEFLKDGKKCTSFPFGINFRGWRAAWVCYERDMQGTPEEGMNELRIVAPNEKGSLFIDHLITATKVDARQQTADLQVPFVNAGTNNHWLVVYKHSLLQPDIELTPVSEAQKKEMKLLEKRFRDMNYTKGKVSDKEIQTIRKKYDFYQITYKNGKVSGVPIFMVRASEAYERIIPNWEHLVPILCGFDKIEFLGSLLHKLLGTFDTLFQLLAAHVLYYRVGSHRRCTFLFHIGAWSNLLLKWGGMLHNYYWSKSSIMSIMRIKCCRSRLFWMQN